MKISRRDFVAHSSRLLFFAPFLNENDHSFDIGFHGTPLANGKNVLLVIHLAGGNDWSNTVISYKDHRYYKQRPNLALRSDSVLKMNSELALNPALSEIKEMYDKNEVAILLNCGLREHNLSHSRATRQFQYFDAENKNVGTWQSRYAELTKNVGKKQIFPAINVQPMFKRIGAEQNEIKSKEKVIVSSLNESNGFEFDLDLHYKIEAYTDAGEYTENGFTSALMQIAELMKRESASIYHLSFGGFDTHENQLSQHNYLLRLLSEGIDSFRNYLGTVVLNSKVLIVICSEFGRTLKENSMGGTDHGYTNHALVIGKKINGGIWGKHSPMPETDHFNSIGWGNLWSTIFDRWLGCSSQVILGQKWSHLDFI